MNYFYPLVYIGLYLALFYFGCERGSSLIHENGIQGGDFNTPVTVMVSFDLASQTNISTLVTNCPRLAGTPKRAKSQISTFEAQ